MQIRASAQVHEPISAQAQSLVSYCREASPRTARQNAVSPIRTAFTRPRFKGMHSDGRKSSSQATP